jgi:hypothetical protein
MALERVERLEMLFRIARGRFDESPAESGVAEQRGDVGEAREAPEALVLPEERRRSFSDRGVGWIGIVEEIGVAGI